MAPSMAVNWLVLLFIAQIVIFSTFMISFFTMESHRQVEQHDMQLELHRLRRDNLAKERKLIQLAERAEERLAMAGDYQLDAEDEGEDDDLDDADADALSSGDGGASKAHCAKLRLKWWVYEACLGERVRQVHAADDKGAFEEHLLGLSDGEPRTGPDQLYGRGDACPGQSAPRQVTVRLTCRADATKLVFQDVSEPNPCHYVAELSGPPSMCPWETTAAAAAAASPAAAAAAQASASLGLPAAAGVKVAPVAVVVVPMAVAEISPVGTEQIAQKRLAVIEALKHSWKGYETYAAPPRQLLLLGRVSTQNKQEIASPSV